MASCKGGQERPCSSAKDPLFLKMVHHLLLIRYRIEVVGRKNLPTGKAVIACNHLCHTDFRFHLKVTRHSLKFLGIRDATPWESVNALIRLLEMNRAMSELI